VRDSAIHPRKRCVACRGCAAIAETVPGFESVGFYGISAPKDTPPEIVDILNKAIGEAMMMTQLVAGSPRSAGIRAMTPENSENCSTRRSKKKWRKVVEFAGVSVDLSPALPDRHPDVNDPGHR